MRLADLVAPDFEVIGETLPAEPEEKISKWSSVTDDMYCLACKKPFMDYFHFTEDGSIVEVPNFCPNCGARMKGVKDGD